MWRYGQGQEAKEEAPASVTWVVGRPPGRCCLEKPVQQTGPQEAAVPTTKEGIEWEEAGQGEK